MAKIIDIIKNAGEVDVTAGIVEEVVKAVPEIQFFDAATIKGTTVSTLARLCNVTATTGLTDGMLRDCIEAYVQLNDGVMPKAIFMSYGARKMLRKSRTLTLAIKNGANAVVEAPTVVDVDGIPVIATNALLDTEAKVA